MSTTTNTTTNTLYSPNTAYIIQKLDQIERIVKEGKEIEKHIGDIANLSKEEIVKKMETVSDENTKELYRKYIKMREQFEEIETLILKQAAQSLGFQERDYLIKPLSDLLQKIKKGPITAEEAVEDLERLVKTAGINKMIQYSRMIPYVGEIIYGIINSLDNYAATNVVIGRILNLLTEIGVDEQKINVIRQYTSDTYFTKKYNLLRGWLADGAEIGSLYPFTVINEMLRMQREIYRDVRSIAYPDSYGLDINGNGNGTSVTNKNVDNTNIDNNLKKGGSGGADNWISVTDPSIKKSRNKKTRNAIHKIKKSIGNYLSRLRRTRRKPLHKSVAAFHIKRGL
jgi:hypothetical protein